MIPFHSVANYGKKNYFISLQTKVPFISRKILDHRIGKILGYF